MALRELLHTEFEDLAALPAEHVDERPRPINTFLPKGVAAPLIRRRGYNSLCAVYSKFERSLGMLPDYVQDDPEKTAHNMLRYRHEEGVRPIFRAVESAEAIVVDGNGDLVFKQEPGRINYFNLGVVELAASLGKPVHFVNSIFADPPRTGRNDEFFDSVVETLRKCSMITLRDPYSVRLANSAAPQLDVEYIPDSQFHWLDALQNAASNLPRNGDYLIPYGREATARFGTLRFDEPYVCVAGGSRVRWDTERAVRSYSALVKRIEETNARVYLTPACSGDEFMYAVADETGVPIIPAEIPIKMGAAVLAGADAFVTGRYHPGILASLSGTPCVFLKADSHKTRSLQELLEYEEPRLFSAWPTGEEIENICALVDRYRKSDAMADAILDAARRRCSECRKLPHLLDSSSGERPSTEERGAYEAGR